MIIEKTRLDLKPEWKTSEYNRWADYIELLCLRGEIITLDDIIDIWCDNDMDNEYDRGGDTHLENSSDLETQIEDYFTLLCTRKKECGEYYPFELQEKNCLVLLKKLSEKQKQYIFLLMCSSICFMSRTDLQKYTAEFEKFSKVIMSILVPENTVVELFGTTRADSIFKGTLRERIKTLAKCLGANTTKSFDNNPKYDNIKGGDDGLDIVAFLSIDEAQAIPFAFAQCTCSFDKWVEKQNSISHDNWHTKIDSLVSYPVFMLVPFSCHDNKGKFYDTTSIHTFLIDRIRIIKLIEKNKEKKMIQEMIREFSSRLIVDKIFNQ